MKCLSLWQPWASILVHGVKRVETRGWPIRHRGPLLIHAAKKWDGEMYDLCRTEPFKAVLVRLGFALPTPTDRGLIPMPRGMPFGGVIGRVNVVECYPTEDVTFDSGMDTTPYHPVDQYAAGKLRMWHEERTFGDYSAGRFAFLCSDAVAFPSLIPFRGLQGLFNVPDDFQATQTQGMEGKR